MDYQSCPRRPERLPIPGHDLDGSEDMVSTPGRLLWLGRGYLVMAIVLVAAIIALPRLTSHATRPADDLEPDNHLGGGTVTRYELLRLWLPRALTDLAKRQSQSQVVRDHGELKRFLERGKQEDSWYALTSRVHQVNGGFVDLTVIRRPYQEPQHFPELLAVLATAVGNPPRDLDTDFSTASITIIPEDLRKREARQVLSELLSHPPSPAAPGPTR